MIDPLLFSFFILSSFALVITPGPVVSLIIAETLKNGRSYGIGAMVGAFVAGVVYFAVYFLGAAALFKSMSDQAFDIMRYAGVALLLWTAFKMFRSSGKIDDTKGIRGENSPTSAAMRGLIVCLSSPKTVLFFAAFFPQFISNDYPLNPQLLLMGISFLLIGVISDLLWMTIALKAKNWIYQKGGHSLINRISGTILSVGAISLLVIR